MSQSFQGHWKVYGPSGFNGKIAGVEFVDGFAYFSHKTLGGEHEAEVALHQLGSDSRFRIVEIAEKDSQWGSK